MQIACFHAEQRQRLFNDPAATCCQALGGACKILTRGTLQRQQPSNTAGVFQGCGRRVLSITAQVKANYPSPRKPPSGNP